MKKISEDKFLENIASVSDGLKAIGRLDLVESLSEKVAKYCVAKNVIDEAHQDDDFTPLESKEHLGEVPNLNEVHDQMVKIVMKEASEILGLKKKAQEVNNNEIAQLSLSVLTNTIALSKPSVFINRSSTGIDIIYVNKDMWANYPVPVLSLKFTNRSSTFNVDATAKFIVKDKNSYDYLCSLCGVNIVNEYKQKLDSIVTIANNNKNNDSTINSNIERMASDIIANVLQLVNKANVRISNDLNLILSQNEKLAKTNLNDFNSVNGAIWIITKVFYNRKNSDLIKASNNKNLSEITKQTLDNLQNIKENLEQKQQKSDPFSVLAKRYQALAAKLIREDRKGWAEAIRYCQSIVGIASSELSKEEKLSALAEENPLLGSVDNFDKVYNEDFADTQKQASSINKLTKTALAPKGTPLKNTQVAPQQAAKPSVSAPAKPQVRQAPVKKEQTPEDQKANMFKKMLDKSSDLGKEVAEPVKDMQEALNVLGYYLPQINNFLKTQNERVALSSEQVSSFSQILENTGAKLIENEYSQDGVWGQNTQKAVKAANVVLFRYNLATNPAHTEDPIVRTFQGEKVKPQYEQIDLSAISQAAANVPSKDDAAKIAKSVTDTLSKFLNTVKGAIEQTVQTVQNAIQQPQQQPQQQTVQQVTQQPIKGTPVSYEQNAAKSESGLSEGYEGGSNKKNKIPFTLIVDTNYINKAYPGVVQGRSAWFDQFNPIIRIQSLSYGSSPANIADMVLKNQSQRTYEEKVKYVYGGKIPAYYANLDADNVEDSTLMDKRGFIDDAYKVKLAYTCLRYLQVILQDVTNQFIGQEDVPNALQKEAIIYYERWSESIKSSLKRLSAESAKQTTAPKQR
jgi:hypothetical protein